MQQNIKQIKFSDIESIITKFEFIIIDEKVFDLYQNKLSLSKNKVIKVKDPEKQKNIQGLSELLDSLIFNDITRKDKILAIGGGALSDLAGLAAATALRGVKWSVIPTTLLSMVDASIGGKVGINHSSGKNLIGAFYQPDEIFIATEFLETLDRNEYLSGLGEVCKYGVLSYQIFQMITHNASIDSIIQACALYKKGVVEEDFQEGARRKVLNLGHTFGHAFEKMQELPHGIAVVFGMQAIVSVTNPYLLMKLNTLIENLNFNLPSLDKLNFDKFWDFVLKDKKKVSTEIIEVIVPREIGQVEIQKKNLDEFKQSVKSNEFFKSFK